MDNNRETKTKPFRMHGYHSFLGVPIVHPVGAYCIRPSMYPAVCIDSILYR